MLRKPPLQTLCADFGQDLDMNVFPRSAIIPNLIMSATIAAIAFAVLQRRLDTGPALALALLSGGAACAFLMEKYLRRFVRFRRTPFPEKWRKLLHMHVAFYRRLNETGRRRFEQDVRLFLDQQRIMGLRGSPVPDDTRVLIAASAATLGYGMPDWEWPDLRDILVFPTGFDEDYAIRQDLPFRGMVHQQGPIIFSEDELRMAYISSSVTHVGLHEMAHVLDMADGRADGIPAGLSWIASAPWIRLMADRIRKVRKGQCRNVLREYAGVNESEFFAVAVEVFFQKPRHLRRTDPELFRLLQDYFHIDPEDPSGTAGESRPGTSDGDGTGDTCGGPGDMSDRGPGDMSERRTDPGN